MGTPRRTPKQTFVGDVLEVELLERDAREEGLERADVVNLALHELFERRQSLPVSRP